MREIKYPCYMELGLMGLKVAEASLVGERHGYVVLVTSLDDSLVLDADVHQPLCLPCGVHGGGYPDDDSHDH